MHVQGAATYAAIISFVWVAFFSLLIPSFVQAVEGASTGDAACAAEVARRAAQKPPIPPPPNPPFPCQASSPCGAVPGTCMATKCKGLTAPNCKGSPGGGLTDQLSKIVQDALKGIMDMAKGQGGGGGGGQGQQPQTSSPNDQFRAPPTCTIQATLETTGSGSSTAQIGRLSWSSQNAASARIDPNLGDVALSGSQVINPVAGTSYTLSVQGAGGYNSCVSTIYNGTGGLNSSSANNLSSFFNDSSRNDIFSQLEGEGGESSSGSSTQDILSVLTSSGGSGSDSASSSSNAQTSGRTFNLIGGISPVSIVTPPKKRGETTISSNITVGDTVVAGFYGSNAFSGDEQTFLGRMCTTRPWASGLMSKVLPTSLFDRVCANRGYGSTDAHNAAVNTQIVPQTAVRPKQTSIQAQQILRADGLRPQVAIWAQPAKVRLGTRTSIFWSSQDVQSCDVTGPSFSEAGVAGGASTVPLSGNATFSVTCKIADGTSISKSIQVMLEI